jgi:cytochrome c peroxidase
MENQMSHHLHERTSSVAQPPCGVSLHLWKAAGAGLCLVGLALLGLAATSGPLLAQTAVPGPSPFPVTVPGQVALRLIKIPEPANLGDFVLDKSVAIQLGKAFFWDMQVGSDGSQACATCHFSAGADVRTKNQLNPGNDGAFDSGHPNSTLSAADFPLHKLADPTSPTSPVASDSDDVVGSQGVLDRTFGAGPTPTDPSIDRCGLVADPVFNVSGLNLRRVTGRNAPTVINAVFNFRNFWDGRANDTFNGVNPFGPRDANAHVWKLVSGQAQPVTIALPYSSLASQATGPGLSPVEMSCDGRAWPNIGHKLLALTPLAKQHVDPTDSVLGPLAATRQGLQVSYPDLIKRAFRSEWWSGTSPITVGADSFSQMEANFSLFWGLAIQSYESTLVSDDTPLDRYATGDTSALTPQQQRGMNIFMNKARCSTCHGGAEFTNASVSNVVPDRYERMHMANNGIAVYDNGFYNTGVRPTQEDLGVGGTDPFGNPLSEVGLCEQALQRQTPCTIFNQNQSGPVPNSSLVTLVNGRAGEGIGPAPLRPPCPPGTPSSTDTCDRMNVLGAFKTPGLRNIELTGPYMHNGGLATLQQIVEFYDRGGDFAQENMDNLDPNIFPLHLTATERDDLVQFMLALTDERVRWQRAPFDHPELCIPNGDLGDQSAVSPDPAFKGAGRDQVVCLAAAGAAGAAMPLQPFLTPAPLQAPTPTSVPTPTSTPTTAAPAATLTGSPTTAVPTPTPTPSPVATTAPSSHSTSSSGGGSRPASTGSSATPTPTPAAQSDADPPPPIPTPVLAPPQVSPPDTPPPASSPAPGAPPASLPTSAAPPAADAFAAPTAPSTPPPAPSLVTMSLDPAVGGAVTSLDGAVTVNIPAGIDADALVVSLAADQGIGNLRLGGRLYLLAVRDDLGNTIPTFQPPLMVAVRGSQTQLGATLDPDTGSLRPVPTTVQPDGTLTISLDRLAALDSPVLAVDAPTDATGDPGASAEATPPETTSDPEAVTDLQAAAAE